MNLAERLQRNAESKTRAENDQEPWGEEDMAWLREWEPGDEALLEEIAEVLGRTIEACRQRFYVCRRLGWSVTRTVTTTTTVYRGWMEGDCESRKALPWSQAQGVPREPRSQHDREV